MNNQKLCLPEDVELLRGVVAPSTEHHLRATEPRRHNREEEKPLPTAMGSSIRQCGPNDYPEIQKYYL